MIHTSGMIAVAVAWAIGGGLLAWLATIPLRRRSLRGQLAAPVLIATVASLAAVVGSQRAMFYSSGEFRISIIVALVTGSVAAAAAAAGSHRLSRQRRAVSAAVQAVAEGRLPVEGDRHLSGELAQLHRQVSDTARRLGESRDRERALEGSRRELIAWVSHDLRTPLAGLRAMAEALEDGVADSPDRYYKQMRHEVDRLTDMVDDLFELSRIQAGQLSLNAERVGLDDLVSDCLAALEPLARANGVTLSGRCTAAAVVIGDGRELNRALTNLVVNAIRHTPASGTVDVQVRARGPVPDTTAHAEVVVRDECGGISDADLHRVFDVGYRGEAARTPQPGTPGGAGLGLAITRGIVEAHEGTVDVHNVDGGCHFVVRLPTAA